MGIKATFNMADVRKALEERADQVNAEIIVAMQKLGEKCLAEARTNKTYMDQTGNLTSSMGYIVIANGQIITEAGFDKVRDAAAGMSTGKGLAKTLAGKFNRGYALIVVAGMHYAAYVEALKGKVVLSSAELLAERELPRMLKELTKEINKL